MISKLFDWLFSTEDEFSKKWMEKISRALLALLIFTVPLILVLLWLHMEKDLSYEVYATTLQTYSDIMKPIIISYFVTFIGYMGKSYLGKRNAEANDLQKYMADMEDVSNVEVEEWDDVAADSGGDVAESEE